MSESSDGKRCVYSCDSGSNLLSKAYYEADGADWVLVDTDTYGYASTGWKDLLTSYNGESITYDAIGNPLTYYGNRSFSWEGRELRTLVNGSVTASYTYNESGIRTSKTVAGVTTTFYTEGTRICYMTVAGGTRWSFLYYGDTLVGFKLGNDTYYYLRNLQGDIVQIVDANGTVVVNYRYDDWGKVVSITGSAAATVGEQNPFRYRGYFYDNESGLYYLNSRYYEPEVGRFINADEIDYLGADGSLTGLNLFAYCGNNPVNKIDPNGNWSIWATIGVAVGAALLSVLRR